MVDQSRDRDEAAALNREVRSGTGNFDAERMRTASLRAIAVELNLIRKLMETREGRETSHRR